MYDISTNKSHRVLTAVFAPDSPSEDFTNRAEGLVGSLNRTPNYGEGGTIKTDVVTIRTGATTEPVTAGLAWATPTDESDEFDVQDVIDQAYEAGYTAVVAVLPTGR